MDTIYTRAAACAAVEAGNIVGILSQVVAQYFNIFLFSIRNRQE